MQPGHGLLQAYPCQGPGKVGSGLRCSDGPTLPCLALTTALVTGRLSSPFNIPILSPKNLPG